MFVILSFSFLFSFPISPFSLLFSLLVLFEAACLSSSEWEIEKGINMEKGGKEGKREKKGRDKEKEGKEKERERKKEGTTLIVIG